MIFDNLEATKHASVADKVMHPALNRDDVGSIPTGRT